MKTMDCPLALTRLPWQLSAFVLSAFGVLALALAAIGLFGVVSYCLARRSARDRHPDGAGRRQTARRSASRCGKPQSWWPSAACSG